MGEDEVRRPARQAVLRELPDEVVDAVVTDPPAGISFLGMRWDTFRREFVGFITEVMGECLRAGSGVGGGWVAPKEPQA